MSRGFFVPNSVSDNFVANQKTSTGDYKWDKAVGEVGLSQQAALQTLNQQYSTTINNAYTNYLAASRGIRGSSMGQGYKEAYMQQAQQGLQEQVAETNLNAANARYQIGSESLQAIGDIQQQYATEVSNMNRVSQSLNDYLGYINSLTLDPSKPGYKADANQYYFDEDRRQLSVDELYNDLFNAQPRNFIDAEGSLGLS